MLAVRDDQLARSLLRSAAANDTFPWLPRPQQRVLIAIAPDAARFRAWAGPGAPEWGAALAFPESRRIVMQGRSSGSDAGDPVEVLRHELAHLALHERLGNKPPRWFDEGYASVAARELSREDVLAANVALALKGTPSLDQLEDAFGGGSVSAQAAYALSYRAVLELASLDPARGLSLFFKYWEGERTMDAAVRQAFGVTLSGFEKEYQSRTRRARDRKRLTAMLAADAVAEQQERESALAALLGEQDAPEPDGR